MPEGAEPAAWDREMARHGLVPGARLVVAVEPHRLSMHGAIVARKPGCCDISRMLGLDVAPANLRTIVHLTGTHTNMCVVLSTTKRTSTTEQTRH